MMSNLKLKCLLIIALLSVGGQVVAEEAAVTPSLSNLIIVKSISLNESVSPSPKGVLEAEKLLTPSIAALELKKDPDPIKVSENSALTIKASPKILTTKHVVQAGEVMGTIAEKYGIPLEKLAKDNDIVNTERIYPGQVLLIKKSIDMPFIPSEIVPEPPKLQPVVNPIEPKVQEKNGPELKPQNPETKPTREKKSALTKESGPRNELLELYDNQVLDQRYTQYQESRRIGNILENLQTASKLRKEILVAIGETKVFKNYVDIKKVAVGNPEVADTIMIDPQQMLINAKKSGITTLTIIDGQNRQDVYYIVVSQKSSAVQAMTFKLKNLKLKSKGTSGAVENRTTLIEAINQSLKSLIDDKNFAIFSDLNTIVVQGSTDEIKRVIDLLDKIDRPIEQILVTAKIAEVDKDLANTLKFAAEGSVANTAGKFNEVDGGVFSYAFGAAYNSIFNQQLQALVSDGKAKLLATPRLLVQSGELSKMEVIESVPFIQMVDNKPMVSFYDAGVVLNVFPQSNGNSTITSFVSAEASNLTNEVYQGYPAIQKRLANTVMTVRDGDTIVIAGLVKENKSEVINKIPLLGDIPFLGTFFTSTVKKTTEVELIISLTQHVIN